jgi:hypothetical protein
MKLVCLSSRATVSCMRKNPMCPSILRQGRVVHNVYLVTLFWVRASFACARSSICPQTLLPHTITSASAATHRPCPSCCIMHLQLACKDARANCTRRQLEPHARRSSCTEMQASPFACGVRERCGKGPSLHITCAARAASAHRGQTVGMREWVVPARICDTRRRMVGSL